MFATVFGLLPFLFILGLLIANNHSLEISVKFVLMTLIPVALSWLWWRQKIHKWLGGYTGDTLAPCNKLPSWRFIWA